MYFPFFSSELPPDIQLREKPRLRSPGTQKSKLKQKSYTGALFIKELISSYMRENRKYRKKLYLK
jgi:hypothetical protein